MNHRVCLVTGANGGLGIAIARELLHDDAESFVWLGVRNRRDQVDPLLREYPERCGWVSLDVTRPAAWKAAVDQILAAHQRLDVLVNNAGHTRDGLMATMPLSDWQEVLATHLDGAFHGCQSVLPTMIAQRSGRIVNMASLSALLAPAGQSNYSAAKAGLVAMTQSLAKEVARMGITVNAVCPGYIETDALARLGVEERKQAVGRVPMRRFGRPEEVAAAVRFLACPEAGYITGSCLKVDGGIF